MKREPLQDNSALKWTKAFRATGDVIGNVLMGMLPCSVVAVIVIGAIALAVRDARRSD